MLRKILSIGFCFIFSIPFNLFSQHEIKIAETESKVPELEQFHEIIYSIWHTAYPAKDCAALRSYTKEVNILSEKINSAKLPGILRDKKAKWEKGLIEFKKSVDEYNKQADGTNDAALLKAAEELHSNYEILVRIIRPVSKEIDEFHKVLYVIYHTYLPNKEYDNIHSASSNLLTKAEAITKAKIPSKFESKSEKIKSAATDLLDAVKSLSSLDKSIATGDIDAAVENIHTKYQKLEELF